MSNTFSMKVDLEKFYSTILKARVKRGFSQTNMSYFLGISQKNYFYLESGRCKMDLIKFLKVADALEINPMEIINAFIVGANWPDDPSEDTNELQKQALLDKIHTLTLQNKDLLERITNLSEKKEPNKENNDF